MKRIFRKASFAIAVSLFGLSTQATQAASCNVETIYNLCTGCTATLTWKMRRFSKSEVKRWCGFKFKTSLNYRKGFKIVDSFALGEIRTGHDYVRLSPLRTGQDRVTVQLNGINNRGQSYVSTIHFNVEVVEGEF
jgi:hypothetical protein